MSVPVGLIEWGHRGGRTNHLDDQSDGAHWLFCRYCVCVRLILVSNSFVKFGLKIASTNFIIECRSWVYFFLGHWRLICVHSGEEEEEKKHGVRRLFRHYQSDSIEEYWEHMSHKFGQGQSPDTHKHAHTCLCRHAVYAFVLIFWHISVER